ncbi:NADH-quinone oxidoreductase subunit C [Candidatus Legionella polyplacis]|uniref:NADH-quinone oxidoreductase subunit C n=1 Tax=Candidatus Legionella polyplacis TaxID=2005262 RepID=A0ABZ2GWA1_9GAMM
MKDIINLYNKLRDKLKNYNSKIMINHNEITLECDLFSLKDILLVLKTNNEFSFNQLVDLCGVDYLDYGKSDWNVRSATVCGFSRAVLEKKSKILDFNKNRFAVVYHLLSVEKNHRVRVKSFIDNEDLIVPSVYDIWEVADWFEREAYDMYGILFDGHPDLRRILTDYGFMHYPLRKDFPIIGYSEVYYDDVLGKVIYEPVNIKSRITVPKVIKK